MRKTDMMETRSSLSIPVVDPFGIAEDRAMPFLRQAIDPAKAERQLYGCLCHTDAAGDSLHLEAIRVVRYKLGRRCLIEYDIEMNSSQKPAERLTLIGKARAKGLAARHYQVPEALWDSGFSQESEHGISVPKVVGTIPVFNMWLQHKVPGKTATSLLGTADGVELAGRITEAAFGFHRAGVPSQERHTLQDELRILHDRLMALADAAPHWKTRLERIVRKCTSASAVIPRRPARGIHRDFYPDQVIVHGSRLYLIDLDLYCKGDPAVDIGNFIGHLTEQSLRTLGDPDALKDRETMLEQRYAELDSEEACIAIRVYATLTLARHIHLSTQFPERRQFTEPLLDLVEQRLDANRTS